MTTGLESRDLLTVEQAAQYLQLRQSSIRSYIRQGKPRAYRIAGLLDVLPVGLRLGLDLPPPLAQQAAAHSQVARYLRRAAVAAL